MGKRPGPVDQPEVLRKPGGKLFKVGEDCGFICGYCDISEWREEGGQVLLYKRD